MITLFIYHLCCKLFNHYHIRYSSTSSTQVSAFCFTVMLCKTYYKQQWLCLVLTWQRGELDPLSVCSWDLCRLDHKVRLNHLRLSCVETEGQVHGELVQGFCQTGCKTYRNVSQTCFTQEHEDNQTRVWSVCSPQSGVDFLADVCSAQQLTDCSDCCHPDALKCNTCSLRTPDTGDRLMPFSELNWPLYLF